MKAVIFCLVIGVLLAPGVMAGKGGGLGDDTPYPLACVDFSGTWNSDEGEQLEIEQGGQCRWLRVRSSLDSQDGSVVIVPDDKIRYVDGGGWKGTIRHRWNSKKKATTIETYRSFQFSDHVVTEMVLLDKVNNDLLLETTFRKTEYVDCRECVPEQERSQRFFRLQAEPWNRQKR